MMEGCIRDQIGFVQDFLQSTSAHGFKYVVEGSNFIERLLWLLAIACAFSIASWMVASNLRDAKENPIAISIDAVPIQEIPFPAVTMNAPKLSHYYRTIQAVYNDVKIDCTRSYNCDSCLNITQRVREDLFPLTKDMLELHRSLYQTDCRNFVTRSKNKTEARQQIRQVLFDKVCINKFGDNIVRVTSACLANKKIYFRQKSQVLKIISKSLRISSICQEKVLNEFADDCNGPYWNKHGFNNDSLDYFCYDVVSKLPDSVLCYAFANWITVIPKYTDDTFFAGVVLKTAYEEQQQKVSKQALDMLHSLINQRSSNRSYAECLRATITTYGIAQNQFKECEKKGFDSDFWSNNLDMVYQFQKQLIPPTSRSAKEKSELEDAGTIRDYMLNKSKYKMKKESILNHYAPILACKYGDSKLSRDCDLFSSIFTTSGVGYAFNNAPFWTLFKSTTGNFAFHKEMYERINTFEADLPRHISRTGQSYSLDFVLRHSPYGYKHLEEKSFTTFQEIYLALHDPYRIPNLKSEGITIQPGFFYDIRVFPTITVTDQSGLALDPNARNCLSKSENEGLNAFNIYSQSACVFECKLKKAVMTCNCSAWEYPRIAPSIGICVTPSVMNECFLGIMANESEAIGCDCLNDCEYVTYDVDLQVTTFRQTNYEDDFGSWNDEYEYLKYLDRGRRMDLSKPNAKLEHLDPGLEMLSRVRISVQTQQATKIIRSARVSFSSQVANLGGIIGLFTGMSILSLAESIYWIFKYIKHLLFPKPEEKQERMHAESTHSVCTCTRTRNDKHLTKYSTNIRSTNSL